MDTPQSQCHEHSAQLLRQLSQEARELRIKVVEMIHRAGSGHCGGSLSAADIMAVLFLHHLRLDPKQQPDAAVRSRDASSLRSTSWPDRDRFIASKGHCAPLLYAVLARTGFIPEDELATFRQLGSRLQGHPDMRRTPGLDMTAGSLGQGLSAGIGMALGARLAQRSFRTYVLIGDGECQEGQVWEAAMAAAKFKLDNLTAICDVNGVQLDGPVHEIMPLEPLGDKWRAFGWEVIEVDGHNPGEVADALDAATCVGGPSTGSGPPPSTVPGPSIAQSGGGPTMILARTVKGKGVSYMEGRHEWHGKAPDEEQYRQALRELCEDAS